MTSIIITSKKDGPAIMTHARQQILFATSALTAVMLVSSAGAADVDPIVEKGHIEKGMIDKGGLVVDECEAYGCSPQMRGKMYDNSGVGRLPITPNLEQETYADYSPVPFRISVDGQTVDESGQIVNAGASGLIHRIRTSSSSARPTLTSTR